MAITVHEASAFDIPRACEIEIAAYADNPANAILFPGPFPPDYAEKRAIRLVEEIKNDVTIRCVKAVDEETGQLIAFAKWHFFLTSESATLAEKVLFFGPGTNQEACYKFFGGLAARKKEMMGNKPHVYLHLLHTDPKHQGRGAGGLLLDWGLRKADDLNLPVYLESSPDAHGFYQKHGLKDIEVFSLDLSQYDAGSRPHVTPIMLKEPTKATS